MKKFIVLAISLFCINYSQAQEYVTTGKVYAFKDIPLNNIDVYAKKSGNTAQTDSLGYFSISTLEKDRLTFKARGFESISKNIKGNSNLNIKMVFISSKKNEDRAIGYGHISQENLTYAISHLSNYNNDFSNYPNIFALIQGKFPGVVVKGNQINIRNSQSFNASTEPLFVVDDIVVSSIEYINPVNVKSIDVLKDSSSSAYGARGGNGVIIITTL